MELFIGVLVGAIAVIVFIVRLVRRYVRWPSGLFTDEGHDDVDPGH